jgi:hypothetical protein
MDRVRLRLGLADSLGLGNLVPVIETKQNLITYCWTLYLLLMATCLCERSEE